MEANSDGTPAFTNGPILRLENVQKRFGDLEVLRGVDMELNRGEVVCVIGPSGSGQVDPVAVHQPARAPGGRAHLPRGP